MDENRRLPRERIVRVRRVDGQVVDRRLLRPRPDLIDLNPRAEPV